MAPGSLQSQEQQRHRKHAHDRWKHAHRNVWYSRLEIVFPNILEVKIAIKSTEPSRKRNQEFGKRGVHIHKKPALDILGRETTETVPTSVSQSAMVYEREGNERETYWTSSKTTLEGW